MAAFSPLVTRRTSIIFAVTAWLICHATAGGHGDLTKGFISVPLDQSNLVIQKPYDVGVADRSSFQNGVHTLWVYATDKPHSPSSHTNPRTEIRIAGYDYSSGVWQFEAFGYVPSNTSGVVVMQIFGAETHATTLMMRVQDGALSYYRNPIYINGELKFEGSGRGGRSHFFKCGVYAQDDASDYMESRWKHIKVLKK
uniref:Alginate lyase 2 domain-containing protein n=1 Tax=Kalanchoe fedtschenkoi TaxID=63787 RepID=A0A7N0T938_KALFE